MYCFAKITFDHNFDQFCKPFNFDHNFILRDVAQLVARLVWDQDVAGSNPVIPTKKRPFLRLKTLKIGRFFVTVHNF